MPAGGNFRLPAFFDVDTRPQKKCLTGEAAAWYHLRQRVLSVFGKQVLNL
jgi:hypothetical protein